MVELDSTGAEIIHRLLKDARCSYRDIADEVGLSPPSVSNRVDRLQELGIIQRFTLELDRTQLTGPDESLVVLDIEPGKAEEILSKLDGMEGVEHVFQTVESRVFAKAVLSPSEIHEVVADTLDETALQEYHVESVIRFAWHPQFGGGDFDIECTICGKTVPDDGETVEIGSGDRYNVCCSSCAEDVVKQYKSLKDAADG